MRRDPSLRSRIASRSMLTALFVIRCWKNCAIPYIDINTSNVNPTSRFNSIDAFRAVTMLLMIFVNDLWTLENVPAWLGHADMMEDRLGFSDVIFPAFLFIVGMSVPLAIDGRLNKGES